MVSLSFSVFYFFLYIMYIWFLLDCMESVRFFLNIRSAKGTLGGYIQKPFIGVGWQFISNLIWFANIVNVQSASECSY